MFGAVVLFTTSTGVMSPKDVWIFSTAASAASGLAKSPTRMPEM